MIPKSQRKASLIILLVALFINWGCSEITYSPPTAKNIAPPTKTLRRILLQLPI